MVVFRPILSDIQYTGLIIVPEKLPRKIFVHYHAGPSAGHMGEHNNLFLPRNRVFWTVLCKYVKARVNGCAQCISYNMWHTKNSELYFSWLVTATLYIMHLDIWSPEKTPNN